jgi:hypothetical protein
MIRLIFVLIFIISKTLMLVTGFIMPNCRKSGRNTSHLYKSEKYRRDTMHGVRHQKKMPMILGFFIILLVSACSILPQAPTVTPVRNLSAPTLAASPTVPIRTSDEIYGDTILDGQSNPTAQALPVDAPLPPLQSGTMSEAGAVSVQLVLEDGQFVLGDLYENPEVGRVAGILLLARDKFTWGRLPVELLSAGFTVLVVELPPVARAVDMDVLLTSLSEEGTVDPARIAVIGASEGADMALLGCAVYLICDALVLLSPQNGESLVNVLPNFNPRPMLVISARNDSESYAAATILSSRFAEGSQFMQAATGRGTGLLALNSELNGAIVEWLRRAWD